MTTVDERGPEKPSREEELSQLARGRSRSLPREFIGFFAANKKWWLAPIVVGLLAVSIIAGVTSGAVAPFIYALF